MTPMHDTRLDETSTDSLPDVGTFDESETGSGTLAQEAPAPTRAAASDAAGLRIRVADRIRWRRTAQTIRAQHDEEILGRLRRFQRMPVTRLSTTANGAVRITVPGGHIDLGGVAAVALANMTALAQQPCRIDAAGRYGRFWWVTIVEVSPLGSNRATALGSNIRLTEDHEGGGHLPYGSSEPEYLDFGHNPRPTNVRAPHLDGWARWPEHHLACWWR